MKIYPTKAVTKEKIRIAESTNMVELLEEEYESIPDDEEFQQEYNNRKVKEISLNNVNIVSDSHV